MTQIIGNEKLETHSLNTIESLDVWALQAYANMCKCNKIIATKSETLKERYRWGRLVSEVMTPFARFDPTYFSCIEVFKAFCYHN